MALTTSTTKERQRKVRTLFFIPSLDGGGAERVMVEILRNIGREKIQPVLVLLYPFEDSPYRHRLPDDIEIVVVERVSNGLIAKIKQYLGFVRTVFKLNPDVIVSMLTHANIMAVTAALMARKRVIVGEHIALSEVIQSDQGKRMLCLPTDLLIKMFYKFAHRIIAVSEGIRANLAEGFAIPARKIEVLHNPIDLEPLMGLASVPVQHAFFRDGVPVILSTGRLVQQKGFDILLRAFRDVTSKMDARLIILGEGPERDRLSRLANDLAIADKVSFPGFQNNPYNFMSSSDIFVLSSRYEGLPMVILEAMACGTPVVSTDCNYGPAEILKHGDCGVLVATEDSTALSSAIQALLGDQARRSKLSALGKERAKDFASGSIVRQHEETILRTLSSKNGTGLRTTARN